MFTLISSLGIPNSQAYLSLSSSTFFASRFLLLVKHTMHITAVGKMIKMQWQSTIEQRYYI